MPHSYLSDNELCHNTSLRALIANEGTVIGTMLNSPWIIQDEEDGGFRGHAAKVVVRVTVYEDGASPLHFIEWDCGCQDTVEEYAGPVLMAIRSECCHEHKIS